MGGCRRPRRATTSSAIRYWTGSTVTANRRDSSGTRWMSAQTSWGSSSARASSSSERLCSICAACTWARCERSVLRAPGEGPAGTWSWPSLPGMRWQKGLRSSIRACCAILRTAPSACLTCWCATMSWPSCSPMRSHLTRRLLPRRISVSATATTSSWTSSTRLWA